MSDRPKVGLAKRISSRVSRIKKHVSSAFSRSRSVSPSRRYSHLPVPENFSTGKMDASVHHAENQLSPASTSHPRPVSSVAVADTIPVHVLPSPQRSTHRLDGPANQNYSSTHLAPGPASALQPLQDQVVAPVQSHARLVPQGIYYSQGMFSGSQNVSMVGNTFIDHSIISDNFMKEFLQHTLLGAEFDSSDRDPPPRCHPGTRLAIVQRCLEFIFQCHDEGKLRWVVGPAGVGKSAVMQIVAEKVLDGVTLGASVFLSVNGRRNGIKTILTIAYQLAVKCEPYRRFIRNEISHDPSLFHKSLSVHFKRFITEPFILRHLFNAADRFLIIIDGLDECDNPLTQLELLELISDFCITHPTSPIVWIIASRPEPHITSFFEKAEVQPAYTKEEIEVDSDQACEDVQRYLRDELKKIQFAYPTLRHKREWPSELEFTKIATAAGGLFAYASTVVRYIGDPHYRDPSSQLGDVLLLIDAGLLLGRNNPLAQLDALYERILSHIPADAMINTRKLLLLYSRRGSPGVAFREQCNVLQLTEDAAYGAIRHMYAVMRIPEPEKADGQPLEYFHKSFQDYLFDFKRSGFHFQDEVEQLVVQILFRIVEEVQDDSDGIFGGEGINCFEYGHVKGGSGLCDSISLSWPGDERFEKTDDTLRLELYRATMLDISRKFSSDHDLYMNMIFFHVLTTRFITPGYESPFYELRDSAFGKFHPELTEVGKLKQVPLQTLDYTAICGRIDFQFTSPIGMDIEVSDPWNMYCEHDQREVDGGWSTEFERLQDNLDADSEDDVTDKRDIPQFNIKEAHWTCFTNQNAMHFTPCNSCFRRLIRYINNNPDYLVTIFVDSTEMCYVELSFVDPDDEVSQWRYRFLHSGPPTCIDA